MKKIILAVASTLLVSASFAQVSIDPEVGMNFSTLSTKVGNAKARTNEAAIGLKAGVGVAFDLNKNFYLKPGIYYTQTGETNEMFDIDRKTTLHYLQIPVNLGYQLKLNNGKAGSFIAEAGPYIGLGLAGYTVVETALGDLKTENDFGDDRDEMNPLDWGFNFGLNYVSPWNVYVKGQYGLGLGNLSNANNVTTNNRIWNVAVGYKINLN